MASKMPEKASERIEWIGDNADRAQQALDDEEARDDPRVTVLEHGERVLKRAGIEVVEPDDEVEEEDHEVPVPEETKAEEFEGQPIPVIEVGPDPSTSPEPVCSVHGHHPDKCADLHDPAMPKVTKSTREIVAGGHVINAAPVPEVVDIPQSCEVHGGFLKDCADLHDTARAGWSLSGGEK